MTDTTLPEARVERAFDAPVERVWTMWTDPDEFAGWYGPPGAVVEVREFALEIGGRRFVSMQMETPNGTHQMFFVGAFVAIDAPRHLEYTESLADADGAPLDPAAAGMPPGAPTETRVIVDLTDVDGRTELVVRHVGIPADSPGATGWQMALEKLAVLLAS